MWPNLTMEQLVSDWIKHLKENGIVRSNGVKLEYLKPVTQAMVKNFLRIKKVPDSVSDKLLGFIVPTDDKIKNMNADVAYEFIDRLGKPEQKAMLKIINSELESDSANAN